jgi:hypothetical protein
MPKIILGLIALLLVGVLSCSDDSSTNPEPTPIISTTVKDLPADSAVTGGHFTFFRFSDSTIVPVTDSATAKWDVAFYKTTIITNSGYRGPGVGGAMVLKNTDFSTLDTVPSGNFNVETETTLAIPTGSGNGWYTYDPAAQAIRATPGVVLVIRTADGKYAKMRILSYYKGAPETIDPVNDLARWYTFEFVYQPDGSKTFTK